MSTGENVLYEVYLTVLQQNSDSSHLMLLVCDQS